MSAPATPRTVSATLAALVAFAANSILCRAALGGRAIDPASFTLVRLGSGALTLVLLQRLLRRDGEMARRAGGEPARRGGSWVSGLALFAYAAAFSFAYLSLEAGTGALILFGSVQATMIAWGLARGERPGWSEWVGLLAALGGLGYLVWPGLTAPPPLGSALMAVAGASWGAYSLRGRGGVDPVAATTGNFVRAVPFALVLAAAGWTGAFAEPRGLLLAAASGALASALGYVVWYAALEGLSATRAAVVQLAVPVLTALLAVALLGERVAPRLVLGGAVLLGGIGLAVLRRRR